MNQLLLRLYKTLAAALLCCAAGSAQAATLWLTAPAASVGDRVEVVVQLSSADAINAVAATLSYPPELLEFVGASKASSIIGFWPEEPGRLRSGAVRLEGVIFDPGWSGSAGVLVRFTFRALAAGDAALAFSDARALANDGAGTNVLTGATGRTLVISAAAAPKTSPQTQPKTAPAASQSAPAPAQVPPAQEAAEPAPPPAVVSPAAPLTLLLPWWVAVLAALGGFVLGFVFPRRPRRKR